MKDVEEFAAMTRGERLWMTRSEKVAVAIAFFFWIASMVFFGLPLLHVVLEFWGLK